MNPGDISQYPVLISSLVSEFLVHSKSTETEVTETEVTENEALRLPNHLSVTLSHLHYRDRMFLPRGCFETSSLIGQDESESLGKAAATTSVGLPRYGRLRRRRGGDIEWLLNSLYITC